MKIIFNRCFVRVDISINIWVNDFLNSLEDCINANNLEKVSCEVRAGLIFISAEESKKEMFEPRRNRYLLHKTSESEDGGVELKEVLEYEFQINTDQLSGLKTGGERESFLANIIASSFKIVQPFAKKKGSLINFDSLAALVRLFVKSNKE
ncbi:hypothetical protein F0P96_04195 [Hymenobacter busanensis]|uniref:Uncharacterized protein n=1 Tax=Hymenobacter busanensis TaxID=2607656 RepID=A0A7L4ZSV8_9BACT|nr:hypothetical protein [Hymenobacter busanensis]KAA9339823.1 hypothetical protein F0P96_04195 [Hymenobacter busanensis]QHJ06424.1 hypothetical protein GUY19_03550 [Hymenobacter busanensis]